MKSKSITDFENYIVFEDGTVVNTNTKKILATQLNTKGYKTVNLWKNNKMKKCLVHRLVANHFIENPNNLPCINHIDKNKLNNYSSNLEWCTYKYNSQYSLQECRTEREKLPYKLPVKQLTNNEWVYYDSIADANRKTGISITTIRTSLKKLFKNPRTTWEYVNSVVA